jgi:adenylate cyclase
MPLEPVVEQAGDSGYLELEQLKVGPIEIPVASDGTMLIPYRGKAHSFPYVSVKDLMDGNLTTKDLQGKIVIMGSSAPGLRDQRSVPLQNVFPGVEIHANTVDAMLNGDMLQQPAWGHALEFIQLLLAGILLAFLLPALGAIRSLFLTVFFLAVGWGFNYYLWSVHRLNVPIAGDFSALIVIFMTDIVAGYFTEGRKQKNMASLFGQYVPPELVKKMADDPLKYSMAGRNAEMTVLFSDIRGFTAISESLSATQLASYINEYLTNMSQIISEDEGTLDKYIGDAIMAFWGAPVDNAQHASYAVKSALRMSQETDRLADSFKSRGLPAFNIGIGLNAGNRVVGDMGSSYRKNYTVMGDPVNLASRLEGLTKYYGLRILVGESVKALATEYTYREIDRVKVKGKETVVTIYTPIGLATEIAPDVKKELQAWSDLLAQYYAGEWASFEKKLQAHSKTYGQLPLYTVYLERVREFKKSPPPANWGGVYAFNEK